MTKSYGVEARDQKVRLSPTVQAEFWFSQLVEDPAGYLSVTFIAERSIDEHGDLDTCHACAPDVSVVTFRKVATGWEPLPVQRKLFHAGAWGKVPKIAKADARVNAMHSPVLLLEEQYFQSGTTGQTVNVLIFAGNQWRTGGSIVTGENNRGDCTTATDPAKSECYSFSSTIDVDQSLGSAAPAIAVHTSGTRAGVADRSEPVDETIRYRFNGIEYAKQLDAPTPSTLAIDRAGSAKTDQAAAARASDDQLVSEADRAVEAYANARGMTSQQLAAKVNAPLKELQAMEFAGAKVGMPLGTMTKGLDNFSEALKDSRKVELLECLGVRNDPLARPLSPASCEAVFRRFGVDPPQAR